MSEIDADEHMQAIRSAMEDAPQDDAPAIEREEAAEVPEAEAPEAPETEDAAPQESVEDRARRFGWKPKEEWKGDTSGWVDAAEYVERSERIPGTVRKLEEELQALKRTQEEKFAAFARIAERQREAAVQAAEQRMAQAKETFDFEGFEQAAADKQRLEAEAAAERPQQPPGPPPEVASWFEKNPGVRDNPTLRNMLPALGDEAVRMGIFGVEAQLDFAERRLKATYPEMFGPPQPAPVKQPTAPAVDGGGLSQPRGKRSTGWDDIPAHERAELDNLIQMGAFPDRKAALKQYLEIFKEG